MLPPSRAVGPSKKLTKYFWRMRSKTGDGYRRIRTGQEITTLLNIPAARPSSRPPTAIQRSPAATLRWFSSTHVDSYQVQVATDAAYASIVSDVSVTDTAYQTTSLENCKTFYWRVRARNAAGTGPYASEISVSSGRSRPRRCCSYRPTERRRRRSHDAHLADRSVRVQYRIELATDSIFTQVVVDQTVSTLSLLVSPLAGNIDHFWRVTGSTTSGRGRLHLLPVQDDGADHTPAPGLLSPSNGSGSLPLRDALLGFRPRATSYRLQVAFDSNFTTLTFNDTSSGQVRCRTFPFLLNSTTYYWRVSSSNAAGTSPFSGRYSFVTLSPPPAPTLIFPANNADEVTAAPVFTWSVPQNALSYRLQVARDSLFTCIFSDDSNLSTPAGRPARSRATCDTSGASRRKIPSAPEAGRPSSISAPHSSAWPTG